MASTAPRGTRPGIANPAWNPRGGRLIGGGCQGKNGEVAYPHAVPPSWNGVAMVVLEQRAYFSANWMVFDVPSAMSSTRVFPCGPEGVDCDPIMPLPA